MGFPQQKAGLERRADQWAACDSRESDADGVASPFVIHVWFRESIDGEVLVGGCEVLADGHKIDPGVLEQAEGLRDFFIRFANTNHDGGFRENVGAKLLRDS